MIVDNGPKGAVALFSEDRARRYFLSRQIGDREGGRAVAFVMLNPSTADAFKLDPTVRRCVRFAERWGFDKLRVVNLFALRSPYPEDLYGAHATDVDDTNELHIMTACDTAVLTIVAWGNHGHEARLGMRGLRIAKALGMAGVTMNCLGTTKGGAPLHPLARGKNYIPDDRAPVRWSP